MENQSPSPESFWMRLLKAVLRAVKSHLQWGIGLAIFGILLLLGVDFGISYAVKDKVYTDIDQLPKHQYAMVLGTAKYYPIGSPNEYYAYRIEAGAELIKQGKVERLLVSGDNATPYYNEPKMMTQDLRKKGIAAKNIEQDYAGYSTLDSVVRADKVYHITPFVIVSQQFHCERALVIAKMRQIEAVCYVAKYPEGRIKVRLREVFARVNLFLDYFFGKEPRTLEKVKSLEPSQKQK